MALKKKHYWIGAAVVVVGVVIALAAFRGRGDKTLAVQTAKVDRQKIVQKVSATGKIQPKTQVEISADVSAKIIKLPVKEGQWVEKGALLVALARERYVAAVESGEANVSSAQANATLVRENMNRTEKEFARSKELLATGLESQSAFEAKQAEYQVEVARYKSATDQVEQAKASLKQARDDLSKTTIYAPMSGTVCALNKEQGEIALGSQFQKDVIMIVADLSEMEAQVNVDENDIVSIAAGQKAEIEVDAMLDKPLTGVVSEISNSANVAGQGTAEQKTEFEIKISIIDPPKTLRPGMTASAEIVTKTQDNALSVPLQTVAARTVDQLTMKGEKRKDAEKRYKPDKDGFVEIVFTVVGGKAVAKQVKTGIQSDALIEIVDGLKEGEVVVTGSYRAISKDLQNGAVVTVGKEPKSGKGAQASEAGG
ncbi:MAG: efflux RND transporter periplasmic adaptor subunit [Candidatus Eisenbacteria bacterium]|uniref:Efflux RND transporter periplasmic adaptor subunit n=1 Tax=Eiseniibacteriota bacterium TaxID=2212470 RepID=A0A538TRS5_UNCEI|nr:MAG: efflux RND transporter periplasmic adaptor subunit [Candidatus Eisenbacteria bacterium]